MIDIKKGRGASYSMTPAHLQLSRTRVRASNSTFLRLRSQAGCVSRTPTVQASVRFLGGTVVTSLDGYRPDDAADLGLPPIVICPQVNGWCILRFRRSPDLDQLIRNAVEKPHRRWSRADGAWRIRANHVRFAEAALFQAGVRIVDVRRGSA